MTRWHAQEIGSKKVIASKVIFPIKNMWRNRTDDRFYQRPLGFHESPQEILAGSDHSGFAAAGRSHCAFPGLGCGAVYLHVVLTILFAQVERWKGPLRQSMICPPEMSLFSVQSFDGIKEILPGWWMRFFSLCKRIDPLVAFVTRPVLCAHVPPDQQWLAQSGVHVKLWTPLVEKEIWTFWRIRVRTFRSCKSRVCIPFLFISWYGKIYENCSCKRAAAMNQIVKPRQGHIV